MVIRVYISGNSGNKEIVTHQQRIFMILNSLGIPNEPVDISAPGMEKERDFMREKCKKKDGQRHALPPQIFNGEEYRGNFDDFDVANEDDVLEDFLGILKKDPAATTPTTTTTSDQPKPATDQSSTDKLGEEAMVTDESDKKESSPQETQPPPIAEVVPTSLPTDHEHKEEEPAKPEGELTPTFVEPVITTEPEQEVIEEEEKEEEEEEEAEIVDGAASKLLLASQEVPETPPKKPVAPIDSDSEEESDDEEEVIPAPKPVDPIPAKPVEKIICPGTDEYEAMMRKITQESEENNLGVAQDIPALGPSLLPEEVPMPDKKPVKLVIEIDEAKANAGFQNIMNAGRFWKASQLIGTP